MKIRIKITMFKDQLKKEKKRKTKIKSKNYF